MNFYFAPMEGITGYIYRNAHHRYFPGMDQYFTPFIQPNQNQCLNSKELNDVLPEHNKDVRLVPQILTNDAALFINTSKKLQQMGYNEVNLNLGCPSKTVVTKLRGSGFLGEPELLRTFFEKIFSHLDLQISVKTRIGLSDPEEFCDLLEIYNDFPIKELTIHPRLQTDYYKNTPNLEIFAQACRQSKNPLCYNGDLFTLPSIEQFSGRFPSVDSVMIGRGLLVNPALVMQKKTGALPDKERLRAFHDEIYIGYQSTMSGGKNVLFKMKELWFYLIHSFADSEKYAKKIKKAEKLTAYESIIDDLFSKCDLAFVPKTLPADKPS